MDITKFSFKELYGEQYRHEGDRPVRKNHSNDVITKRNGGIDHQFIDSIGGCSANYTRGPKSS